MPIIIFESDANEIQAYILKNEGPEKYLSLGRGLYKLEKAFGNYLLVKSLKEKQVKLLELGGIDS